MNELKLCVIVPAKDEASTIHQTLTALYHQVDPQGKYLNKRWYEIIVFVNNCTDATAEVVRQFAATHSDCQLHIIEQYLAPPQAHIGYVRRTLMDVAFERLCAVGLPRGVIASTDGDSTVENTWVYYTLKAIEQGADVVGGRIIAQPQPIGRRYYLQDVMYRYLQAQLESVIDPNPVDPWPRHFQNFGPSLAVTTALYERAGRLPVLSTLEDVRFYEALQRCDARIRHCPRVRVLTSARTQGRVDFGFSVQLQRWERMLHEATPFLVPEADYWRFRFTLQRQVRCAWQRQSFSLLQFVARSLLLSPYELYDQMRQTSYFGTFWQELMVQPEVEAFIAQRFISVDIATAITDLRHCIRQVRPFASTRRVGTDQYADDHSVKEDEWFAPRHQMRRAPRRRLVGS